MEWHEAGRPSTELTRAACRRRIAVVDQNTHVVHGTLRDNIACAEPDATEAEIRSRNRHDKRRMQHFAPPCDLHVTPPRSSPGPEVDSPRSRRFLSGSPSPTTSRCPVIGCGGSCAARHCCAVGRSHPSGTCVAPEMIRTAEAAGRDGRRPMSFCVIRSRKSWLVRCSRECGRSAHPPNPPRTGHETPRNQRCVP